MNGFVHWLAHLTGWNHGVVVSWQLDGGAREGYIGFQCATCKRVNGFPAWHLKRREGNTARNV